MILSILAHGGEEHGSEIAASIHEVAWYYQLPVFFLALLGIGTLIWLITKKLDLVIMISSFLMLITGFLVFQVAPLVSIISITLGLVATLAVTLVGLGGPQAKK